MNKKLHPYIRPERYPHRLCAGCGHGIIQGALIRAFDELELPMKELVLVAGIGCAANVVNMYIKADTVHVHHGRPVAFATGIKVANPQLTVLVVSGDGDLASIGGNHLIHAARRNIDLTVICGNNFVYGTTGGQMAATTPLGDITVTTPSGNQEPPFDLCSLVAGAGGSYVARCSVAQPKQLINTIKKALVHRGFSFVDALSICPVQFGRRNNLGTPGEMITWLRKNSISKKKADTLSEEELRDRWVIGEFCADLERTWSGYLPAQS
jgi:2-oxoglutarate ferredoxin oxidoreductase subunit beta